MSKLRPGYPAYPVAFLSALGLPGAARADVPAAPPCAATSQNLDGPLLSPAWREAVAALQRDLAAGGRDCHLIAVSLERDGGGVRVRARSADGAETSRVVLEPQSLSAVTFGLLAGIPREPPRVPVAAAPDDPHEVPPAEPVSPRRTAAPSPFDAPTRVTVSFATGARLGVPTTAIMAEFELRADIVIHQWLLTVSLRGAPLAVSTRINFDGDDYQETAIAFGVGRELRLGRSALQLTGGPGLAYTWMETDTPSLVSGEYAQLRLGAVARWGYPVGRSFRFTVTVDGEIVPRALVRDDYQSGLPPFPQFTTGLRLGGEVVL